MADVPIRRRTALSAGQAETTTLVEALVIDQATLFAAVFPELQYLARHRINPDHGFTRRMAAAGALAFEQFGPAAFDKLVSHGSDTVRGWAAYVLANQADLSISQCLQKIRPLADDPHFGVREWAWIALRPTLMDDTETAIEQLQPWTRQKSANLRRFASEITRPRGVWCPHWKALKASPEIALPLLTPLNSDPERYVQDSVANWLNDAAKSQPEWVISVCTHWLKTSSGPATRYICKRAQRSII